MSFGYPRELPLVSGEAFISFNDNDVADAQVPPGLHPFLALLETQKILPFPSDPDSLAKCWTRLHHFLQDLSADWDTPGGGTTFVFIVSR